VHHAVLVHVGQRTTDVASESRAVIDAQRATAREDVLKGSAAEVLTDHEDRTGLLTTVEDAREVRMAQRGGLDNPLTKRATNVS